MDRVSLHASRPLPDGVELRPPAPGEGMAWARFLVDAQVETYRGLVPDDFAERAMRQADPERLDADFADPGTAVRRIAWQGERIVGIASATDAPTDWEVALGYVPAPAARELGRLYVDASMHGTGLGGALLDAVVDERPHYLWLIDGNARAARFYERRGFRHLDEQVSTGPSWGGIPMHRMVRP